MDDEKIRALTEEVQAALRRPVSQGEAPGDLESRVAALEAKLRSAPGAVPASAVAVATTHSHPSLRLLDVPGGSDHCVLEPDKPCVQSGQCRSLGH